MQRCLVDRDEQALRLLNHTGAMPRPLNLDEMEPGLYQTLLHNASILYNETLITCNKTEFLTVRTQ